MPFLKTKEDKVVDLLYRAVQKRLMTDVPWGVLLSGGLDSSIIASIVTKMCKLPEAYPVVHTFSIGLKDSPDLEVARKVAEELGTMHHEIVYSVEEGLDSIPDVIRAIETYDTTTVRASVPMYLLASYIRRCGIKMVLSGEGADELFAGYSYNKYAPSPEALYEESVYKMDNLHAYDCLRANKSTMAHSVECRVPFLDKEVVAFAMSKVHPSQKMWKTVEKRLLRDAFQGLVPEVARIRKKAQFSDAVGSEWIQACRKLQPSEFKYYKKIFNDFYPNRRICVKTDRDSIACSSNRVKNWFEASVKKDPSGNIEFI